MSETMGTTERREAGRGDGWTGLVLGVTLLAVVLVTGLNFTFSAAVMPNLADVDDQTFVTTLQRYNDNPVFPVTFTLALLLAIVAPLVLRRYGPPAAVRWSVVALVLVAVVFALTMIVNVPLNTEIDQLGDLGDAAAVTDVRDRFETQWVVSNAVRTVLSIAAVGALTQALVLRKAR
ncbi:DUF1772 domain-containing protein [Jiangella alkaliphila]|uniref:Uncharacterized membrane protein n=1 Tax=Jiangella alkaliphila TaxID=419479 RepID=A0A1H2JRD4_9ACTN|nr:DUF1772 domain-containing protein [Jiangella alkaliphila]SDU58728.1 Uncharacterized membrane protein [Jiangella alkaliphila]